VNEAQAIGRNGPFLSNLIDRLPIHPSHDVPLLYKLNEGRLGAYLNQVVAPVVFHKSANAGLGISHASWHVVLYHSHAGTQLDVANSEQVAHDAFGSLSKQVKTLQVVQVPPVVTDADARQVQSRVEGVFGASARDANRQAGVRGIAVLICPDDPLLHETRQS